MRQPSHSPSLPAAFFHAVVRQGQIATSGAAEYVGGHRVATADGVFGEWRWDGAALHVRSDRYAAFPLFYFERAGEFCVSPSLLALASRGAPLDLDEDALAAFLRLGFFLGEDTPLRSIRAMPPGGHLVWRNGVTTITGGPCFTRQSALSRDEAVDAFVSVFRRAIERRIGSGGPVLLPLSGGRDSRHILLALVEAGAPPEACVTVRPFPPQQHQEISIAATVAHAVGVPHRIVEQQASRVEAERRKNWVTHFCSDEHAHFLALADYLASHAHVAYDGLAGDMLSGQSSAIEPQVVQLLDEERFGQACELLFEGYGKHGIEDALRGLLAPSFYERVSREVAIARVTRELVRHTAVGNRALSFFFWNRTLRELALAPYAMMHSVTVFSPYLDHEVFDLLSGLPHAVTADHQLHTDAIHRAYPHVRGIPFETGRTIGAAAGFARRTAFHLAGALVSSSGAIRRRYVLPRLAAAAATGRPEYLWFLPLSVYVAQLDAATRHAAALAPR